MVIHYFYHMEKLRNLDNILFGFVLGLLTPIITLIVVYFYSFEGYTLEEFIQFLKKMRIISKLFSLCVIPNLAIFFLFLWPNFLKGARGTLLATFLIAIVVIIIQFMTVGL